MSCEGLHHAESRKKYDKRKKERETCWRKEPGEKMRWTERERERESCLCRCSLFLCNPMIVVIRGD